MINYINKIDIMHKYDFINNNITKLKHQNSSLYKISFLIYAIEVHDIFSINPDSEDTLHRFPFISEIYTDSMFNYSLNNTLLELKYLDIGRAKSLYQTVSRLTEMNTNVINKYGKIVNETLIPFKEALLTSIKERGDSND